MPPSRPARRARLTVAAAGVLLVGPLSLTPALAQDPVTETVVGELVQAYVEPGPGRVDGAPADHEVPAEALTWIEPASGEAVRVPTEELADVPVGSTVEVVVGEDVADEASTDAGLEPAREVLAAEVVQAAAPPPAPATAASTFTNMVTVVMVTPPGTTQDATTRAQLITELSGPVTGFWARESNDLLRLGVQEVYDWRATTAGCDDPVALWDEAAGQVGWTPGPGKHLMLYVTSAAPGCEYGLAEVGSAPESGGRLYVSATETSLLAHELGHNFSLGHSGSLQCHYHLEMGDCRFDEYGDFYDVMGYSWEQIGSLSTMHAAQLGFLPETQVRTFDVSDPKGTVALSPVSGRTGVRAIRLIAASGDEYWLEFRTDSGQDDWLGNANPLGLETGVLIRTTAVDPGASALLDATGSSRDDWDGDFQAALYRGVPLGGGDFTVDYVRWGVADLTIRVVPRGDGPFPREWTGDEATDLIVVDGAGGLYAYPGNGSGGFQPRLAIGSGWRARDLLTMVGDWDGDGHGDMICRNPTNGDLWLYSGNGAGRFRAIKVIGRGWQPIDALFSPGDWNHDGNPDLFARYRGSMGELAFYAGDGRGGISYYGSLRTGWANITSFVPTGDWDGDGVADFIARHRDGTLYLFMGEAPGLWFTGRARVIGRGWHVLTGLLGPGDWNGDGTPDLIGRQRDGSLWLYPGNGSGGFLTYRKLGTGWGAARIAT